MSSKLPPMLGSNTGPKGIVLILAVEVGLRSTSKKQN